MIFLGLQDDTVPNGLDSVEEVSMTKEKIRDGQNAEERKSSVETGADKSSLAKKDSFLKQLGELTCQINIESSVVVYN